MSTWAVSSSCGAAAVDLLSNNRVTRSHSHAIAKVIDCESGSCKMEPVQASTKLVQPPTPGTPIRWGWKPAEVRAPHSVIPPDLDFSGILHLIDNLCDL